MQIIDTPISDLKIIKLNLYGDERGFFIEKFKFSEFKKHNLPEFVQDNHSNQLPM